AARSGVDLATAERMVAHEFPNPTANLSTSKIGTHEAATSLGNDVWERSYDSIAAVNQLIEIAGKRSSRKASAEAGVLSAEARLADARRLLNAGVAHAYLAALLAETNVAILDQSAGSLRKEADIAGARLHAGDISEADKSQIEIAAAQLELQARTAESTATAARIALEVVLGMANPHGIWAPGDSLDSLAVVSAPAGEVQPGALRPDLAAAEADLKKAHADLRLQQALRVPDPTVSLGVEHEPPGGGPAVDTFNLGLSFPLPLWNQNRGNIDAARATEEQFRIAMGKVQAQVAADIASAEDEYNEARARWLRYRDELAPESAKVRETVAFAYEKGGASLVDLLQAERTDNDVRLATVQAMSDTAGARADLEAAQAVLTPGELKRDE
ncbi:MAG TPA: TolC family protein, partial [Verrucomicrobiae bacterium]|nr:TolC family protein [Verrucomicrobiae bacterium]